MPAIGPSCPAANMLRSSSAMVAGSDARTGTSANEMPFMTSTSAFLGR